MTIQAWIYLNEAGRHYPRILISGGKGLAVDAACPLPTRNNPSAR
jgi:hypothetical protein